MKEAIIQYNDIPSGGCMAISWKPLVRCKDCKHGEPCNDGEIYCEKDIGTFETAVHKPDWFCADGERKEEDE